MTSENDNIDLLPLFIEFRPGFRKRISAAVEALVDLLDQIDDDGDREEDDAPEDDAPCEDVGDDEPSLGATTAMNQAHGWRSSPCDSSDEAEPSLGWTGHGRGHPEMALRGYDDDREATTGPRDEEDDDSDKGELDGDYMDSWFNPPHLPGGNGPTRRQIR
jgi:hypothetical protein